MVTHVGGYPRRPPYCHAGLDPWRLQLHFTSEMQISPAAQHGPSTWDNGEDASLMQSAKITLILCLLQREHRPQGVQMGGNPRGVSFAAMRWSMEDSGPQKWKSQWCQESSWNEHVKCLWCPCTSCPTRATCNLDMPQICPINTQRVTH